jgi:hypothetical protein
MSGWKKRKIEEQLKRIDKRLAAAEEYVARNVNIEGSAWLHFDDWRGKSGHPSWMRNWMIPATGRLRARKEEALEILDNKAKDRNLTRRRQQEAT